MTELTTCTYPQQSFTCLDVNSCDTDACKKLYYKLIIIFKLFYFTEPINTFNCSYTTEDTPIRISYHRNVHYNSIVDPCKASIGVGLGLPGLHPGVSILFN